MGHDAKAHHHRHLQQHAEGIADVIGAEIGKTLGTIAALQQERATFRNLGQGLLQAPRFAREYQGRHGFERVFGVLKGRRVRVFRHLADRF